MSMTGGAGGMIQGILSAGAGKTGLTMANKDFMKLNRGGSASGARSQTGQSRRSAGTRKTGGTRSRKDQEIDFDEMEIEEIDAMIEESERLLNEADKERKKINKKKMTPQQKAKMTEPYDNEIKMLRERIIFLVAQ